MCLAGVALFPTVTEPCPLVDGIRDRIIVIAVAASVNALAIDEWSSALSISVDQPPFTQLHLHLHAFSTRQYLSIYGIHSEKGLKSLYMYYLLL